MINSKQQFFTGTQYTGTVLFLVLALGAPLAAIFLSHPFSSLYLFLSFVVSAVFSALAFSQWKYRSQLSILSIIDTNLRSK